MLVNVNEKVNIKVVAEMISIYSLYILKITIQSYKFFFFFINLSFYVLGREDKKPTPGNELSNI